MVKRETLVEWATVWEQRAADYEKRAKEYSQKAREAGLQAASCREAIADMDRSPTPSSQP